MANSLSLTSAMNQTRIFECPNCKQTIDTSALQCRFCSATIDPAGAELAADAMAGLNQACSDASYLRTAGISMLVFLGLMFVPFVTLLGLCGFYFLLFAIPVWAIRWWIKFWKVKTTDSDFRRAKSTTLIVGIPITLLLLNDLVSWVARLLFHISQ